MTVWRPWPTNPVYEVSDEGQVRATGRPAGQWGGARRSGVMKTQPHVKGGYPMLSIYVDGKKQQVCAHRLVLETFVGPRPDGLEALHGDRDPENNRLGNLKWGTKSENQLDKQRHGTDHQKNKTHCPAGHPYSEENTRVYRGARYCRTCAGWTGGGYVAGVPST